LIVERVMRASPEVMEALARLVPQLTQSSGPPAVEDLQDLLQRPSSFLLVARNSKESGIIGMGALGIYRVPTGIRAVIEDVVVDETARGKGVAEEIVRRLIGMARGAGAPAITLTSNPRRQAANALYLRLGFERRETNSYVYRLS
jgi:ribosomal protein S18 acetylase RimI-like enzyme